MKKIATVFTALLLACVFLFSSCQPEQSYPSIDNTPLSEASGSASGTLTAAETNEPTSVIPSDPAETPTPTETPVFPTTVTPTPVFPTIITTTPTAEQVHVTGVSFPVRSISMSVGEKKTLTANVKPENADDQRVTYTVGDLTVFSYEYGEITALAAGSAALIAKTADGGFSATCYVNVVDDRPAQTETPEPTSEPTVLPITTEPTASVVTPTPAEPTTEPTVLPITTEPPTLTPTPTLTETPVVPTETPTLTPTETPADFEIVEVSARNVRHIFTHCLIIDPAKGCGDPHVYPYGELDADCLTVPEFKALLQSLYDKGFCLININDMYVVDDNGGARLADSVRVYKGKKPLVISIDDVVYDGRKKDCGMISRLVVDANGQIAGEIDHPDGSVTLNYEECFCLLEEFLKTHPDFSFEGSKFTLAITGFAGILGYRTDEQTANAEYRAKYKIPDGTDYLAERERVKPVIEWFKTHGYNFASHTYSHSDYTNCSLSRVESDIEKWNRNVKPLIGETKVLVYPYGAFTYADTEKHQRLLDEGFVVFCGTSQLNTLWDGSQPKSTGGTVSNTGTIYLERFTVTGFTLRTYASKTNYVDYYTSYYKELDYDEETARMKALDLASRMYDVSHNNSLEYYDPNEIYDSEHRYYQILPET